jgi:hypothetical protein
MYFKVFFAFVLLSEILFFTYGKIYNVFVCLGNFLLEKLEIRKLNFMTY